MNEYLRKRFEERIWESEVGGYLQGLLDEHVANRVVEDLVEGLLIEVGDE